MKKLISKQLCELLQGLITLESKFDRPITGLTLDSRKIQSGDLFFAKAGIQLDGREFITEVIAKGAAAVIVNTDFPDEKIHLQKNVPIIPLQKLTGAIGLIAARFYDYPTRDMQIIGVTGTNGKTSTTHFIAQALTLAGFKCGIIGTLGAGIYGHLTPTDLNLTTPEPIALQHILAEFRDAGVKFVAMEVSSHSLVQERINGIEFSTAVFTNLTRDHLDYHGDMENYAQAKRLLFDRTELKNVVINGDDEYGRKWLPELVHKVPTYIYSQNAARQEWSGISCVYVHHANFNRAGISASLHTPWGDGLLHNSHLIGRFNLSNLLATLIVLRLFDIPLQDILLYLGQVQGVVGRMEALNHDHNKPLVVIDYAHTPDALEQVLRVLREHCDGKLWCVFGCGGDRDRGKRPLMGKIVEDMADHIVITNDNPRRENPRQIIKEIVAGMVNPTYAVIEHDRRRAIAHAINCAHANDIVLIAGKGHEPYQIIGEEKLPFSDMLEAQLVLNQM